jgi:hypothetical protein
MSTPIAPGWDKACTPALHSVQVAEAREVYCGHGIASYDMCVNYADRIRACDSCSICQCAKHCLDAVASSVMLFQEDQSQPGPAGNQCYVYTSCTKGCGAAGATTMCPCLGCRQAVCTENSLFVALFRAYRGHTGHDWCIAIGEVKLGSAAAAVADSISWVVVALAAAVACIYVAGGVYIGRGRGMKGHVHAGLGRQVAARWLDPTAAPHCCQLYMQHFSLHFRCL